MERVIIGRKYGQKIEITAYSEEQVNKAVEQFESNTIFDIEISKEY